MGEPRRLRAVEAPYDTSDPKQVEEAKLKADLAEERRTRTLANLLSTPEGREWVWAQLSRFNIFSTSLASDPYTTYANEGARNVGLALLAEVMRADPNAFALMQQEAKSG